MACFCETVLIEKNGGISAIRLIDQLRIKRGSVLPVVFDLALVIGLISGAMRGEGVLHISCALPSGDPWQQFTIPFRFLDQEDKVFGFSASLNSVSIPELGTYWWEIRLYDQLLTRIPLQAVYG